MKNDKIIKLIAITFITLFSWMSFAKAEVKEFTSIDELKTYYPKEVTISQVKTAIDSNSNLTKKYKDIAKTLLVRVDPDIIDPTPIDLRIFYENIKTLKIDESEVHVTGNVEAKYDEKTNTLYVEKGAKTEEIAYGMAGAFFHFYHRVNDNIVTRNIKHKSLDIFASYTLAKGIYDYKFLVESNIETSSSILKFLDSKFGNHLVTFYEYSIDAGNMIINKYKNQYSSVDIDYIMEKIDKITVEETKTIGNYFISSEDRKLLDELFKILEVKDTSNIDEEQLKYNNFIEIFTKAEDSNLVFEYLDKYRNINGYNNYLYTKEEAIEIYEKYKEANTLLVKDGELYPAFLFEDDGLEEKIKDDFIIKSDGTKEKINISDNNYLRFSDNIFSSYISSIICQYHGVFNFPEIDWKEISKYYHFISPHYYEKIYTYYNDKVTKDIDTSKDTIEIGIDSNNKIGFIIRDKDNNIVLETLENLKQLSNKVMLANYIGLYSDYIESIRLEKVLNENYLKSYQSNAITKFNNIEIKDNSLTFINKEDNKPAQKDPNDIENPNTGIIIRNSIIIIGILSIIGIKINNKRNKIYKI